tara:strand:- start:17005 stop:18060 length:1056 start_codon:yes stop_codon:yes gene_type:complete
MSKDKLTLIITGAGGWLGKSLVDEIRKEDVLNKFQKVILCTHSPKDLKPKYISENFKFKKTNKFEWIFGDLKSEFFYKNLNKKLSSNEKISVIYAASLIHAKFSSDFFRTNLDSLKIFTENLQKYQLSKFLYISSNSPFGFNNNKERFNESSIYNPIGNYGKSKKKAELFLLSKFNKNTLKIIRAPWFHGNFMPERQKLFLKKSASGSFPIIFPGTNKRSIVNTKDLAIASINLITRNSKKVIYWVCEEKPISMKEFIYLIQDAARNLEIKKGGRKKYNLFFLPPLTSTIFCFIDRLLQKIGIYSKIIHVIGELGMNIEANSELYRNEFKDHQFINIYESIHKEIEEAFLN